MTDWAYQPLTPYSSTSRRAISVWVCPVAPHPSSSANHADQSRPVSAARASSHSFSVIFLTAMTGRYCEPYAPARWDFLPWGGRR
ncbi:hypothetical protein OG625_26320 [Streptomyces sp. NBC_01351]|uniref:hypothetical protein n=1 Tax=Streptomyces sp. NBC_01351 TaxID=2903833 RepID=UPI002E312DD7|nr:hypothetical protein [Streptomyces sp. NBC_01351]